MSGDPLERQRRFRALYEGNYDHILRFARRRTDSGADADDVVAETFLTAWRRLAEVPSDSMQRPWLYGVARRVLANQRRSEKRRGVLGRRLRGERSQPDRAPPEGEIAERVEAAFEQLAQRDREILALAYWEDLETGEIAVVLGCSRNAARIRLHRARRRLARELEGGQPNGLSTLAMSAPTPMPVKETK